MSDVKPTNRKDLLSQLREIFKNKKFSIKTTQPKIKIAFQA
jgi:hypothetical protein